MEMSEILEKWEELKPLLDKDLIDLIEEFKKVKNNEQLSTYFKQEIEPIFLGDLDIGEQEIIGAAIIKRKEELSKLFKLNPVDNHTAKTAIEDFLSLYVTYFYTEAVNEAKKIKAQKIYQENIYLAKQETLLEFKKSAEEIINKPKIRLNTFEYIKEKYAESNQNLKNISQKFANKEFYTKDVDLEKKLNLIFKFYEERTNQLAEYFSEIIKKPNLTLEDSYQLLELRINFISLRRETENLLHFPNLSKEARETFLEAYEERASEKDVFMIEKDQIKFHSNNQSKFTLDILNDLLTEFKQKVESNLELPSMTEEDKKKLLEINTLLNNLQNDNMELFQVIENGGEGTLKYQFIQALNARQFDQIISVLKNFLEPEIDLDNKKAFKDFFAKYKDKKDEEINQEINEKIESLQKRINTLIENTQTINSKYLLPEEKKLIEDLKEKQHQFDIQASRDKNIRENPNDYPNLTDIQPHQIEFNLAHDNLISTEQALISKIEQIRQQTQEREKEILHLISECDKTEKSFINDLKRAVQSLSFIEIQKNISPEQLEKIKKLKESYENIIKSEYIWSNKSDSIQNNKNFKKYLETIEKALNIEEIKFTQLEDDAWRAFSHTSFQSITAEIKNRISVHESFLTSLTQKTQELADQTLHSKFNKLQKEVNDIKIEQKSIEMTPQSEKDKKNNKWWQILFEKKPKKKELSSDSKEESELESKSTRPRR